MEATEIVASAISRCAELAEESPNFYPLQSVMDQLRYIECALADKTADRVRLATVNIGLFAAKEFESRAPEFANMLYEVDELVALMRDGKL